MPGSGGNPAVGSRLIVGKHSATIRYIGPVDGQDGTWAGLEWDDTARGKHDGTNNGKRYFTCLRQSTAGSFVRLPKLLETADLGQSLASAIQLRYKNQNGALAQIEEAYVPTVSHRKVPIRLVGAEAAAEIVCTDGVLEQASFIGMRISDLAPTPDVVAFLERVSILDLSSNLISSWHAVTALVAALPSLQVLNLSGNLLDLENERLTNSAFETLPNLTTLVLNGCAVTWQQAAVLLPQLPHLRSLHLCDNNLQSFKIEQVVPSEVYFTSLQTLDLESNNLSDWTDLAAALKDLPSLKTLLLSENSFTEIKYPGNGFNSLQTITLGSNKLDDWSSVDALDQFTALVEVRLSENPLVMGAESADARYQIIARMSKLKVLNGAVVSPGERWDAELAYLRQVTDEAASAEAGLGGTATKEELLQRKHPKFSALVGKYGELVASKPSASNGTTLASSMVELVFVAGKKEIKKKVPGTLTIGRLKPLVERVLRIKLAHQTLSLIDPTGERGGEDITLQDGRELRFYEVSDGWKVEVGKRDAAAEAAAKDKAAAEQERKMEEHERGLQRLRAEEERLLRG